MEIGTMISINEETRNEVFSAAVPGLIASGALVCAGVAGIAGHETLGHLLIAVSAFFMGVFMTNEYYRCKAGKASVMWKKAAFTKDMHRPLMAKEGVDDGC